MPHGKLWHSHAKANMSRKVSEENILTPTQQKLHDWAIKHDADPDSEEALIELENLGFDVEHPPTTNA